ncbi:MFS transporter [Vibrio cyclitrophicus]|nr:MFS transporter [Vibrio cyclitrophicus]UPR54282.1 MFS transporter [Vibrio cyclitrophicus]
MMLTKLGEFTLLAIATLTIMVGAALAPGLNSIANELGVSEYASFLITLPALGAILFAPVFGKFIDTHGARKVLMISLLGYGVFGLLGMFLYGPIMVAVDRIVLGGFTAGVMASGTAVISDLYRGQARLNMIAKQGMSIELGGCLFLFAGGLLSEVSWQGPFLLYSFALLFMLFMWKAIPVYEYRQKNAVAAPHLLTTEPLTASQAKAGKITHIMVYSILAMTTFFSMFVILPVLLGDLGFSQAQTGFFLSFISFIAVLSAMVMPKVVTRFDERVTLRLAFVSYALAHTAFASSSNLYLLVMASMLAGIGFGLSIPLLNHATVLVSDESNRGKNLALFAMAVFLGQFLTSLLELSPFTISTTLLVCALASMITALNVKRSFAGEPN